MATTPEKSEKMSTSNPRPPISSPATTTLNPSGLATGTNSRLQLEQSTPPFQIESPGLIDPKVARQFKILILISTIVTTIYFLGIILILTKPGMFSKRKKRKLSKDGFLFACIACRFILFVFFIINNFDLWKKPNQVSVLRHWNISVYVLLVTLFMDIGFMIAFIFLPPHGKGNGHLYACLAMTTILIAPVIYINVNFSRTLKTLGVAMKQRNSTSTSSEIPIRVSMSNAISPEPKSESPQVQTPNAVP